MLFRNNIKISHSAHFDIFPILYPSYEFWYILPTFTDETSFELEWFSVRNSKKVPDQLMVCGIGDL